MLRVGLTGGLGSGKSTAAAMFQRLGAQVLSADDLGRTMMQPGHAVFRAIVRHFGDEVLDGAGGLDRAVLARLSFAEGRAAELNAIVHPAVIARQGELAAELARHEPNAVLIVESALLFETEHAGAEGWRTRFDRILLVRSSLANKVQRFVARTAERSRLDAEARASDARDRLARQIDDVKKAEWADFVIENDGSVEELRAQVNRLWPRLLEEARGRSSM